MNLSLTDQQTYLWSFLFAWSVYLALLVRKGPRYLMPGSSPWLRRELRRNLGGR
ncbi:hypothetical protein [Gloeobacter kilaueensis]|uniref:Uncharacterized protein n=1 Tax=Gloeobacter kilaueensis (strain ATCC BAA-2537 / CCAP 1431/1 / ULC 316 / JS1) TaxID=1183438 RepID=U5QJQ8_GLOK1|nr:hypothetical protein [Gloeobacter kilaueensis]AGY59128.1 hypothetical protein GKIL_2882 [Gloeobacter kilaueensis JS1]